MRFLFLLYILSYFFEEKLHGFGIFSADNVEQILKFALYLLHLPWRMRIKKNFGKQIIVFREQSDKYKQEICKKKKIHFFMIPNSMVKEYEHLRTIILASKRIEDTQASISFEE